MMIDVPKFVVTIYLLFIAGMVSHISVQSKVVRFILARFGLINGVYNLQYVLYVYSVLCYSNGCQCSSAV